MQDGQLADKYVVAREDGKFNPESRYLVLNYARDPYAWTAMRAYADACEQTHPMFAADLRASADYHEEQATLRRRSAIRPAWGKEGAGGAEASPDGLAELLARKIAADPDLADTIRQILDDTAGN